MVLNNDILLGVEVTYGTFAFLLILSALFGLVIFAVSKLPVPERFRFNQFILVLLGIAIAALVSLRLPVFGLFLLAAALLGVVIAFLPRSWKVSLKMALRNLDRRRVRTRTTMVALFIGVLSIALVVGLGQALQTQVSASLAQNQPYNVVALTSGKDTATLQAQLHTIAGLAHSSEDPFIL